MNLTNTELNPGKIMTFSGIREKCQTFRHHDLQCIFHLYGKLKHFFSFCFTLQRDN